LNVQIIIPPEREGVSFREVGFTIANALKRIRPTLNVAVDPWTRVFVPNVKLTSPLEFNTWDLFIFPMTVAPNATTLFATYASPLYSKRAWYYGVIEGKALGLNDLMKEYLRNRVVTPSNFSRQMLEESGIEVKDVIPHGFMPEQYGFKGDLVRSIIERFKGKILLYYLSSGIRRKGITPLIEAMSIVVKKHPEALLYLDVLPQFMEEHWRTVQKFKLQQNVVVEGNFGSMSKDQVVAKYHACDLYIHGSFSEGFGIPICLPPGTNVITKDGIKPIEHIKVGDEVLTHRGKFRRVTDVKSRYVNDELIEIVAYSLNCPTQLTKEHLVLSFKRPPKGHSRRLWAMQVPSWIRAADLQKGDCIVFPVVGELYDKSFYDLKDFDDKVLHDEKHVWYKMGYSGKSGKLVKVKRCIPINEELAKLVGWYIAEGSVNRNQMTAIEFSLGNEPEAVMEIIKGMKSLFGVDATVVYRRGGISVIFSGSILAKFFSKLCGTGARNKRIPLEFLYGKLQNLRPLVESMVKGDGSRTEKYWSLSTSSRTLKTQFVIALIRLGFKPSVSYSKTRDEYNIFIWLANTANYVHSNKSWFLEKAPYIGFLVRSVRRVPYQGKVYNLCVEEDESYVTEELAVHNCEAMLCGKPSVCVDASPMNEHIDKNCGWLVPYHHVEWENYLGIVNIKEHIYKPEAFAEAIIDALDHPEEIKEKGVKAYEKAINKYNYLATYKRFLELE
jgi:glycosyltransferase involved in cell wall biosynthesis